MTEEEVSTMETSTVEETEGTKVDYDGQWENFEKKNRIYFPF